MKQMVTRAAWLWLPLFLAVCIVLGFYNSITGPDANAAGSCAQSSHLDRFLGCP